jgi:hypothetical protein
MALASVRRSVWRVGSRRIGKGVMAQALNYYKFNTNDRRNLLGAYNKYLNSLNNTSARMARVNAEAAATRFVNTMFRIYEKANHRRPGPVANGISSGVQKSLVYWLPGVMYRRAVRGARKYQSAPTARR